MIKNREIKFRVWNIVSNLFLDLSEEEWGYYYITPNGKFMRHFYGAFGNPQETVELEHVIIQQYTGLLDKNKKEIYEGDIVKYCRSISDGIEHWSVGNGVLFDRGCFWVGDRSATGSFMGNDYKGGDPALMYWQDSKWLEVIGNIFENQDLLK